MGKDKIVILATYCSSRQIRNSEITLKSKKRLLPFIQRKSYCTPILQRLVVYILRLQHQRRLTVYCPDGSLIFWGNSSVRKASNRNEQHSAVLRSAPLEVSDSNMTSALTDSFPGVRIRRFVKSDRISLQTVQLTFPSKAQFDKATTDGIFIDHLYYQPVEFIRQGIRIIRCYRCQTFDTSVPIAIRKCLANIAPMSTLSQTAKIISLPVVPIAAEATKLILLTVQLILNRRK